MHIVVYCPECQSRYQLHADLRGRRMRCPNQACRATFTVQEATSGPPRDPNDGARVANARGELVVPLRADETAQRATLETAEVADWRHAPPPVQVPAGPSEAPTADRDLPVLGTPAVVAKSVPPPPRPAFMTEEPEPPRRGRWVLLVLVLLCAGLVGGGGWVLFTRLAQAEDNLRAEAEKDYQGASYRGAAQKYRTLSERFGRSPRAAEYRFLTDLSETREALGRTPPAPAEALPRADDFLAQFGRDPLFKDHREELGRSLWTFGAELAATAEAIVRSPQWEVVTPLVEQGRRAVGLVRRVPARDARPDELDNRLSQVETAFATAQERKRRVAEVLALLDKPKPDLRTIHSTIQRYGLGEDPAITAARLKHENTWRQVAYEPLNRTPLRDGPPAGPPGLLLEPPAPRNPKPETRNLKPEIILAVSRGLLYALDRDGQRLWAARVGLDAGDLPVRVPARGDEPELVLVAGTDPPALTARNARTGAIRWHQPLEGPVLGRPVLAGGRLFAATGGPEGAVYDFEASSGLLRGRFATGQQLAAGVAFDITAGRLYVPASGQYVYVFTYDTPAGPHCDGWLTTGHAPGSLRGEPIVVSGEEGIDVPHFLVLGETDGLGAMRLRAFRLLPTSPTAVASQAEVRLPGWSWFPPYHDGEKLALVTDTGAIGLIGIRQEGTADRPLFPLLGQELSTQHSALSTQRRPARAQLVHAEEDGFWVLAGGALQRWRLGMSRREGWRLTRAWEPGVALGAPLHAGQVSADRATLYLVTQTDTPPAHWVSAVDARSGRILWRRPLGLSPRGDPVLLGSAVLVLDTAGGLYRFDPSRHPADPPDTWQSAGEWLAEPVPELLGEPELLRAADGQSAYAFLCRPAEAGEYPLDVRRVTANGMVETLTVRLPAPPAGTPALGPNAAVLPLTDGSLCRVTLDFGKPPQRELGPNWRAPGSQSPGRGHVLHWHGDEYLVWDGGRRLKLLRWRTGTDFKLDSEQSLEFTRPPISAPVRLSDADGTPTGAVAEAGGLLTLFHGTTPRVVRNWRVGGAVTAGPWAVGDKLAVVVERHTLVWLDPAKETPLWTAKVDGDGIEAAPLLMDGRLVVADLAGRFTALDAATGQTLGAGYRHPAEVAPAASPVPFGPQRLFAPLTDGSVLLLTPSDLERPAAAGR